MTSVGRVLVVDNNPELLKIWKTEIGTGILVESAFDTLEVRRIFDLSRLDGYELNGSYFQAIVVTDSVLRQTRDYLLTLLYLRKHFQGPIIAAADKYEDQLELVKAGCCTRSQKREVPETIYEKLGLLLVNGTDIRELISL